MNARFFISVLKPHQTNRDISRRHLAAAALFALTDWLSPPFGVESLPQGGIFFFGGGGDSFIDGEKEILPVTAAKNVLRTFIIKQSFGGRGWMVS